jgi:succinate-acetate transporter protein
VAEGRDTLWNTFTAIAAALAITGAVVWPFLFEPLAVLFLLTAARSTASRRFTGPVAGLISLCTVIGASVAVAFSRALY